ncbi:MAG: SEC-C metal-binding domain-containing protein [Desulfomonilaceae bacterium]
MKKIKSPWYGALWILVWTAALSWFLASGMFNTRESVGLVLVWLVLVGVTGYFIVHHLRQRARQPRAQSSRVAAPPALNSPCPCGSGKKYKRCCGA